MFLPYNNSIRLPLYVRNHDYRTTTKGTPEMKTWMTIVVMTAMSAAVASAQPGQGPSEGGKKMKQRPNPEQMMKDLDLTTEQQDALKQAQRDMQKQMVDLRADVKDARDAARSIMTSASVTRDEAMKAVESEAAAELTLRKAMVDHRLKVRDIIGPENAAKMIELREERREERREKFGPGKGRGPGYDDDERGPPRD
jgi:Spy/CpxP family protein refolding chaperone